MGFRGRTGRSIAAPRKGRTTPLPPSTADADADKLIGQLIAPKQVSPGNAAPGGIGAEAEPGLERTCKASRRA